MNTKMTQAEKKKSTKTPSTSHREAPTKRQKAVNGLSAHTGTRAGYGICGEGCNLFENI